MLLTPVQFGNLQKLDGPTEQCQDVIATAPKNCTDPVNLNTYYTLYLSAWSVFFISSGHFTIKHLDQRMGTRGISRSRFSGPGTSVHYMDGPLMSVDTM